MTDQLRDDELRDVRSMIEEFRYRQKRGIENAHVWSNRQKFLVAMTGLAMLGLQTVVVVLAVIGQAS